LESSWNLNTLELTIWPPMRQSTGRAGNNAQAGRAARWESRPRSDLACSGGRDQGRTSWLLTTTTRRCGSRSQVARSAVSRFLLANTKLGQHIARRVLYFRTHRNAQPFATFLSGSVAGWVGPLRSVKATLNDAFSISRPTSSADAGPLGLALRHSSGDVF